MLRHLVVSASYEGDCIPVTVVRNGVEQIILDEECRPTHVASWTSACFLNPQRESLLDAWTSLTDEDRVALRQSMPRLFSAIFFAVRGTEVPEKRCAASSDAGHACQLRGEHDVHISEPVGAGGSQVWRSR